MYPVGKSESDPCYTCTYLLKTEMFQYLFVILINRSKQNNYTRTEHWASEKGQMVSNKTVGLSNYWALCMQKLPSNIVLTYLSTEIQIYCSFFPHKNELLGISWEVLLLFLENHRCKNRLIQWLNCDQIFFIFFFSAN
jgi:hypothetical protein